MRLGQDLRLGLRLLVRNKTFSVVAVLVLALGIGVNTAIFSLVNVLLLRPLNAVDPDRVVGVYSQDRTRPDSYRAFSYPEYRDLREHGEIFQELVAHNFALLGLGEGESTRRVFASVVSANYFSALQVRLRGRGFTPAEEEPGAEVAVAVASQGLWKRLGSPEPGQASVRLNGRDFTLVGVAPEGFSGTMALLSPELWIPLGMYDATLNDFQRSERAGRLADRTHRNLVLVGVLQPGLTLQSAAAPLAVAGQRLAQAYPAENGQQALSLARLGRIGVSTQPVSDAQPAAATGLLMAMASLVLLIACLNLANMLLARGETRRKEIAIRLALGAGRFHVVTQLLTEGLVLALIGGAAGLLLATVSTRLLVASLEPLSPLPIVFQLTPDIRVLAATLAFCVLATLLAGLGPAWRLAGADALPDLKEQAGAQRGGRRSWMAPRNLLVVGQLALSLALLTTGGLFVRGALAAAEADPGFRVARQLVIEVDPALGGDGAAEGRRTYRAVLDRLRALPGVDAASLASTVPFGSLSMSKHVLPAEGAGLDDPTQGVAAQHVVVGADYFRTLGLPVLRGREFQAGEEQSADGPRLVIVDEPLARKLWPDGDPIGRQVRFTAQRDGAPASEPMQVIGVVPGLRQDLTDPAPVPHVYQPFGANYQSGMNLHVRAAGGTGEAALLAQVRGELRAIAPRLPIVAATTFERFRDDSLPIWMVRTGARLFTLFGLCALALAVVGVYGVKSYVVACRTREIGIRMALGATGGDVVRLVLREGLTLTVAGVVLGLGLALAAGRVVASLLYQVSPADPLVFVLAPLLLAAAAMLAAFVPARRATRVAPASALRGE
jgi:predicted permease